MLPPILKEIQRYSRAVERNEIHCDLPCCPRCGQQAVFKLHDRRKRTYLVVLERFVKKVLSLLTRWKCEACRETFTFYPPFALARKRYLRQEVLERARRYLAEDQESYRKTAKHGGLPLFYEADEQKIDERSHSHTTAHRWLTFLGSLTETCLQAGRLLREKAPSSEIFRGSLSPPPWKYRSEARRELLGSAWRLLSLEVEYRRHFGRSIFPRFATPPAPS